MNVVEKNNETDSQKEITKTDTSNDYDVTVKDDNYDVTNQASICDDTSTKPALNASSTSSDSETSFHDNAYKFSLRNLLRKSLSFTPAEKATQPSSSESDDITDNTVIEARGDDGPISAEDLFVDRIVETAIQAATDNIIRERASHGSDEHCGVTQQVADDEPELPSESTWGTPKLDTNEEEPESPFLLLHPSSSLNLNQSTSTKVDATLDGSNEPNENLEPKELLNFPVDGAVELSGSVCFETTVTDDLTMLQPALSNTVSDRIVDDTKENCDPTMETGKNDPDSHSNRILGKFCPVPRS